MSDTYIDNTYDEKSRFKVIETGGRIVHEQDFEVESRCICENWHNTAFLVDCHEMRVIYRNTDSSPST